MSQQLSSAEKAVGSAVLERVGRNVMLDPTDTVRSGDLDIAFAVERQPRPARYDGLDRTLVARDWLRLAVPDGTLETSGPVDLDLVAHLEFIAPPVNDAFSVVVHKAFATMSSPPLVAHRIVDFPTILRLVAAGAGVALVPDLGLSQVPEGVTIYDLAEPQHRVIELLYRSSSAERPVVRAFLDAVADVADRMGLDRGDR